jgi:hypothetical protein
MWLAETGDKPAVRAILKYSCYLLWHYPRSELLEVATSVAREAGFTLLLPQCLLQLGSLLGDGHSDGASAAFEEARKLFLADGNLVQAADCLQRLGDNFRMQSRTEEAYKHWTKLRTSSRLLETKPAQRGVYGASATFFTCRGGMTKLELRW